MGGPTVARLGLAGRGLAADPWRAPILLAAGQWLRRIGRFDLVVEAGGHELAAVGL
ncbi:MAG TPA: hypothetical protein VM848_16940 [Acidimicrobiia bacterium]|nr:hypothetical protein [Acidimicrobiia bacterium]